MAIDDVIRKVVDQYGGLRCAASELATSDDLYRRGLTSHASVNLMLALEAEFDLEFSDTMLRKSTFESIEAIRAALVDLGAAAE
jgi:acyl carrier protein